MSLKKLGVRILKKEVLTIRLTGTKEVEEFYNLGTKYASLLSNGKAGSYHLQNEFCVTI